MKAASIITGILMVILGICAMAMPFRTFLGIGWLVGALFLIYGIETVVAALTKDKKDVWACIFGVLIAILGLWITFSAFQRVLTDLMIAYLVGFNLVLYGVMRCVAGYKLIKVKQTGTGVLVIICGVISILAGLFSVGHPIMTMFSVGIIIGANLLVQGISMIVITCAAKEAA